MTISLILDIVYVVGGFLLSGIPLLIGFIRKAKAAKNAKNEVDKQKALADMREQMELLIQAAEIAYKDINATLKAQGSSAGPAKKDSVKIKLQSYAASKNYEYDDAYWDKEIDKQVKITKNVNI